MERVKEMENVVTALLTSPAALKWVVSILAAAMASVVACLMSQPGDMILTETYKSHSPRAHSAPHTAPLTTEPTTELTTDPMADPTTEHTTDMLPSGTITPETLQPATMTEPESSSLSQQTFATVIQAIYARGGLTEFFRGLQARLVHVGMIITSQLVIYDIVKQLLGLPATGSH
jgi:Mitochondrial carrier protein